MKVRFDHRIFSLQKYGGVSRYFFEVNKELAKFGIDAKIRSGKRINAYLNSDIKERLPFEFIAGRGISEKANYLANEVINVLEFGINSPDIIHHSYYDIMGRTRYGKKKTVITVYDMIHEKYPSLFDANRHMSKIKLRSMNAADHIIAISASTKRDIVAMTDIHESKVTVIHLAASNEDFFPRESVVDRKHDPYFLYVGTRQNHKNFDWLLECFSEISGDFDHIKLVAFGANPFTSSEKEEIARLGLEGRVEHVGGDDDALRRAYQDAIALIYPSEYEGFGLPPLEAMMCGCPVACSNVSSMPEVVGDSAILFDPSDKGMIEDAMRQLVDGRINAALADDALRRAERFSWSKCARETLEVYRSIL